MYIKLFELFNNKISYLHNLNDFIKITKNSRNYQVNIISKKEKANKKYNILKCFYNKIRYEKINEENNLKKCIEKENDLEKYIEKENNSENGIEKNNNIEHSLEKENNLEGYKNIFISNKIKSNKIFSYYTKSYIYKESEDILILCIKKLNEYEKVKENTKISLYVYELQNLSKSKISYNVLKKIDIINNLFEHINENVQILSPSLLLSLSVSYKKLKLNKYSYYKKILISICNHIKLYKSNKFEKYLKTNKKTLTDDYKYTIELLDKKKKNKKKINMLNVYTNKVNNSVLSYILYSYSSFFTISNSYLLYICKYILLNICTINSLDILSLLYFINRSNIKIKKKDIPYYSKEKHRKEINDGINSIEKNENKLIIQKVNDLEKIKNVNNKYEEYKNTYLKILRSIIYIINKKHNFYENSNIFILILYYYFKMNLIPIQIFYKLHFKIKKNIKNIDFRYLSLYLYILSNIKFNINYYKFIYKNINKMLENKKINFNLFSLSVSFYSLSKNQYYDMDFINNCLNIFYMNVELLNDINITNIIYTLGKLKIENILLCNKLCELIIKRIDNISAINLSLIVHNLSKIHYKNDNFYLACLKKCKEMINTFTIKQLIIFADALILNNIFDFEFFELFFNKIIKYESLSNIDNKNFNNSSVKRKNMLNRICFSLLLEQKEHINNYPLSIKTVIGKNIDYFQEKNYQSIHEEITNIFNYLEIDNYELLNKKKPYVFDIFIKNDENIYIDILSSYEYIKNKNKLCAYIKLKKRHMDLLNIKYFFFNKNDFLSFDNFDKKKNFIKSFLKNVCKFNFEHKYKIREEKKQEIVNLFLLTKKQEYFKNVDKKYNNYIIQNKDYNILPSSINEQNIIKNYIKKKKEQLNYYEPLIKRQQIFIHCDDNLLNKTKLSNNSFNKKYNNKIYEYFNNTKYYLFQKKCHGLNKNEFIDKETNKITIKKY